MKRSHYVIRGGLEGRERLRVLSRIMRPSTISLLQRVPLRDGMVCLDVGCGGGDVSREIARMVGPRGRVVGIDMDASIIELARREAAELKLETVEFRVAQAGEGGLEQEFDVVYARFLLTHLTDPAAALAQMVGLLRPGGMVILEDIDFRGYFCEPDSAAFQSYVELYTQVVRKRGADPNIGPRLPTLLLDAGCHDISMNVVQPAALEGEVKLMAPLTLENIADSLLADGLASREELDRIVSELYDFAENPRTVMSVPRVVQAWGRIATA